jgi:F-type H+-transporting ATPase subunit epsilon
MAGTLQLELVSPERLLLSRAVEMATIPAIDGEMGVLPGHSPTIVVLRGGVIRVREGGQETERLFVAGGFAEVSPDRCTILADEATPVGQVSRAAAETRLREAEAAWAEVQGAESPERREAAMLRLLSARAMLDAAEAA